MTVITKEVANNRMYFEVDKYELEMLEDTRFSRLKMYVAHSGQNNNKSNIDLSVLVEAESSIINIPILAHVNTTTNDFGEHEIEYDEETEEITYIEKPIGLIPAINHNYHYEDIDGKTYAVVYGYVWNVYAHDAVQIINREEDVKLSMEIVIDSSTYDQKTKILDIKKFRYTGITLLGKKYGTGMVNSHALLENFSEKNDDFSLKVNELNQYLMNFSEVIIPIDQDENKIIKEEDIPLFKNKQEIAVHFKLTVNQLCSELDRVISTPKYITKNYYGDSVERQCYYLNDYDEAYVYYVDVQDGHKHKKAPYVLEGDNVTVNFSESRRIKYSPVDWEDSDENEINIIQSFVSQTESEASEMVEKYKSEIETQAASFASQIEEKDESILTLGKNIQEIESKFSAFEVEIKSRDEEISSLTAEVAKYKKVEDDDKVEGLFVEYTLLITEDEKKELVEKRAQFSSFNEFEKEVKSIVCDRIIKKAKDHKMNFISMGLPQGDVDDNLENKKPKSLWERLEQ